MSLPQPPERRKPISRRLRFEILRRDNNTCRYCGGKAPNVALTVDHVVPVALGGSDEPSNLTAACKDCNAGKTSTSPDAPTVAQVSEDASRWAEALEVAAATAAKRAQEIHEYVQAFDLQWSMWGSGPHRTPIPRPGNWETSVKHWRTAGLPIEVLIECVRIAMGTDRIDAASTWRYCCGIAWNRVRQIQDEAQASL